MNRRSATLLRPRLHIPLWLAVGGLLALAGCGASGSSSSPANAAGGGGASSNCSVVFGTNTEITGPFEAYGGPSALGLEVAAKAINAAGGVKVGSKTCTFVAANEDNKSDPSQVFPASQKVIDAHAVASLGPDFDDTVAYSAFKKANVIDFVTGGQVANQLATDPSKTPLAVGIIPFQNLEHAAYLRQAIAFDPSIKRIAVLYPNDGGGQEIVQQVLGGAKLVPSVTVVSNVAFPDSTSNYSAFLTKIKATHPDLLVAENTSQQSQAIIQQAIPLGVAKSYMSETATSQTIQSTPGTGNTTIFLPTFAPTYSKSELLPGQDPKVIFGNANPPLVPGATILMYYTAWLLKQAVEKAGSTNAQAVFNALKGQSYTGPFGTCSVTSKQFVQCETEFLVVQGPKVTVETFATPYDTKPKATYTCTPSSTVCAKTP
jgi:branched-chain amino acid transport system substrate-binding protein